MLTNSNSIIALDVGGRRIGVAVASAVARIARPCAVVENNDKIWDTLQKLTSKHDAAALVVGLPRGLSGQHTAQTQTVETFIATLKQHTSLPVFWQDEAVTSQKAKAELHERGNLYEKGEVDALAATYILEDFLAEHPEIKV